MRDRLIELIKQAEKQECLNAVCGDIDFLIDSPKGAEFIADYLLANGVIVSPYKVGQIVWRIRNGKIEETTVEKIVLKDKGLYLKLLCNSFYETSCRSVGKTVFLTKEEAEAKLKGEQ